MALDPEISSTLHSKATYLGAEKDISSTKFHLRENSLKSCSTALRPLHVYLMDLSVYPRGSEKDSHGGMKAAETRTRLGRNLRDENSRRKFKGILRSQREVPLSLWEFPFIL